MHLAGYHVGMSLLHRKRRSVGARLLVTVPRAGGLTWLDLARELAPRIGANHTMAFAGNIAFRSFLAIVPTFVLLLSLLGAFGASELVGRALDEVDDVLPEAAFVLVRDQLLGITESQSSGVFTLGAIVSIAVAIWAVSGMVRTVTEALNVMLGVVEGRSFVRRAVTSVALALVEALCFLAAMVLVVVGPGEADAIGDIVGLGDVAVLSWTLLRIPLVLVVVAVALGLLFAAAPDVDRPIRPLSHGAVIGTILWLAFSLAFAAYVNGFGSYNATYGAIAGVVVAQLYALYVAFIVLVGAEIDAVVAEHR